MAPKTARVTNGVKRPRKAANRLGIIPPSEGHLLSGPSEYIPDNRPLVLRVAFFPTRANASTLRLLIAGRTRERRLDVISLRREGPRSTNWAVAAPLGLEDSSSASANARAATSSVCWMAFENS